MIQQLETIPYRVSSHEFALRHFVSTYLLIMQADAVNLISPSLYVPCTDMLRDLLAQQLNSVRVKEDDDME